MHVLRTCVSHMLVTPADLQQFVEASQSEQRASLRRRGVADVAEYDTG